MAPPRHESIRDACDRCHDKKLKYRRIGDSCQKCLQTKTVCQAEENYTHLGCVTLLDDWNFTESSVGHLTPESLEFQTWTNGVPCTTVKEGRQQNIGSLSNGIISLEPGPLATADNVSDRAGGPVPGYDDREGMVLTALRSISNLNLSILKHATSSVRSPKQNGNADKGDCYGSIPRRNSRLAATDANSLDIDELFRFSQSFISICNRLFFSLKQSTVTMRTCSQAGQTLCDASSSRSLSLLSDASGEQGLDAVSIMSIASCFLRLMDSYDDMLEQLLGYAESGRNIARKQPFPSISIGKFMFTRQGWLRIWFIAELARELFTDLRGILHKLYTKGPTAYRPSTTASNENSDDGEEQLLLEATIKLVERKELKVAEKMDRVIDLVKRCRQS